MKQKFFEWFTRNNNGCAPAMATDGSFEREKTQHMFEAYQAGVAEGEARCAALAAENAGLKAAIPPLKIINDVTDSWDDVSLAEDVGFNYAVSAILKSLPETPSTDAYLSEVRAKGVDSAVETIMVHMNHQHVAVVEALHILRTHAAQLRKGVQS